MSTIAQCTNPSGNSQRVTFLTVKCAITETESSSGKKPQKPHEPRFTAPAQKQAGASSAGSSGFVAQEEGLRPVQVRIFQVLIQRSPDQSRHFERSFILVNALGHKKQCSTVLKLVLVNTDGKYSLVKAKIG
jgi:hypothetical protein